MVVRKYAESTQVPVERSKMEIEKILKRYGATSFGSGWKQDFAIITFEMANRRMRFRLPMPKSNERRFWQIRENAHSDVAAHVAQNRWEQAVRQKWRALFLIIKAKLEGVESEVECFEDAWMSHIVMPNGRTVGENIIPQIEQAYLNNEMPPLLGSGL